MSVSMLDACVWRREIIEGRVMAGRARLSCDSGQSGRTDLNLYKTIFIRGVEGKNRAYGVVVGVIGCIRSLCLGAATPR